MPRQIKLLRRTRVVFLLLFGSVIQETHFLWSLSMISREHLSWPRISWERSEKRLERGQKLKHKWKL